MEENTIRRIEKGLVEKRENLYHWLESAPAEEKQVCLCEDDTCMDQHLNVIDASLKKAEDGTLGICKVCHGYVDDGLLEMDYTSNVCLDHFSPEERRRLEAELELSQIIQRALLPQELPSVPGMDLAVFSRPSDILGGDYFDFLEFKDGAFGMAIADVVGHGVSASIIMSSLQTALRTLVPQHDSPAKVLEQINHFYIHNINLTTFITAFLAHFDSKTQTLTYSNAGHTPPLVLRQQGNKKIWLKPTGAAIGLVGMMIRKLIRIYIELVGEAFLMLERDGLGVPVAWWPLPPNWIANTPTPTRQTYQMNYRGWHQELPATEIV